MFSVTGFTQTQCVYFKSTGGSLKKLVKTRLVKWVTIADVNWPTSAVYFCILIWLHNAEENPKYHNKQLQRATTWFFFQPNMQVEVSSYKHK